MSVVLVWGSSGVFMGLITTAGRVPFENAVFDLSLISRVRASLSLHPLSTAKAAGGPA
jgi:hypothetical protein